MLASCFPVVVIMIWIIIEIYLLCCFYKKKFQWRPPFTSPCSRYLCSFKINSIFWPTASVFSFWCGMPYHTILEIIYSSYSKSWNSLKPEVMDKCMAKFKTACNWSLKGWTFPFPLFFFLPQKCHPQVYVYFFYRSFCINSIGRLTLGILLSFGVVTRTPFFPFYSMSCNCFSWLQFITSLIWIFFFCYETRITGTAYQITTNSKNYRNRMPHNPHEFPSNLLLSGLMNVGPWNCQTQFRLPYQVGHVNEQVCSCIDKQKIKHFCFW